MYSIADRVRSLFVFINLPGNPQPAPERIDRQVLPEVEQRRMVYYHGQAGYRTRPGAGQEGAWRTVYGGHPPSGGGVGIPAPSLQVCPPRHALGLLECDLWVVARRTGPWPAGRPRGLVQAGRQFDGPTSLGSKVAPGPRELRGGRARRVGRLPLGLVTPDVPVTPQTQGLGRLQFGQGRMEPHPKELGLAGDPLPASKKELC